MGEEFQIFGRQFRDFLQGFLKDQHAADKNARVVWGRFVDPTGLPELFANELAPKKHTRGVHPPAGIDNMRLRTVDVFRIPGMGEFKVPFDGYFQVTRSAPSTPDWRTATVYVNFTDLRLFGEHPDLGGIMVDLNPDVVSAGNTFPGRGQNGNLGNVACRINVAARFHLDKLGFTLFNKTPIQLLNDDVQGIPTIGEGGQAHVGSLPMYRSDDPDGELFGYIEELEYMVLNYADRDETMRFRAARSFRDFRSMR